MKCAETKYQKRVRFGLMYDPSTTPLNYLLTNSRIWIPDIVLYKLGYFEFFKEYEDNWQSWLK